MSESLIIPTTVLLILVSCILYFYNRKINRNIIFLSGFLIIYSIQTITISILNFGGPVWLFAVLLNNFTPLYYLYPVYFYFFVKSTVDDTIRIKKRYLLHYIPFAINLIAVLPYIFTSYDYKYLVADKLMGNYIEFIRYDFGMLYPAQINLFARPIIFFLYLAASMIAVWKFIPVSKSSSGSLKSQFVFTINVTIVAIFIFGLLNLAQLFVSTECFFGVNSNTIYSHSRTLMIISSLFYLCIPIFLMFHPKFLYGLPQIQTQKITPTNEPVTENRNLNDNSKTTIIRNGYDDEKLKQLAERMTEYISSEKPYLDNKFSVHDICYKLDVPRHHVQYCLSVIMNKSFTSLKNQMRVSHAMELMKNNMSNNFSLEGIGKQSGFASNSNFYVSFKEITGITPSEWMKENLNTTVSQDENLSV